LLSGHADSIPDARLAAEILPYVNVEPDEDSDDSKSTSIPLSNPQQLNSTTTESIALRDNQNQESLWKQWWTMKQALTFAESFLNNAIIIAFDKNQQFKKGYSVTTRDVAYDVSANGRSGFTKEKYLYEVLDGRKRMRLYYDAEFCPHFNPGKELLKDEMKDTLRYYAQIAYMEISNRPVCNLEGAIDFVAVETSHREDKVSFHGKIPARYGVVDGMESQRAFWAHVLVLASTDLDKQEGEAHLLRIKKADSSEDWFLDTAVYGSNQLMRTVCSSMYIHGNPLIIRLMFNVLSFLLFGMQLYCCVV
jgi:hypothetical protein